MGFTPTSYWCKRILRGKDSKDQQVFFWLRFTVQLKNPADQNEMGRIDENERTNV
jgi:hypothetical protein